MAEPIEVFYWPTPNGHKITIALEEMGMAYRITPVNIAIGDQFKPEFLAISPNNRMPAIVDPDGPGGKPISVFESGAILQYLARKAGRFYGTDERNRVEVEEWLFWQVGGLGPMAGQGNHFRNYGPSVTADQRQLAYGAIRYTNEVHRLYGVLNGRLKGRDHVAGDYSIADMALWPWTVGAKANAIYLDDFPHVKAWHERVASRPTVIRAVERGAELRRNATALQGAGPESDAARRLLFNQRAR